ncbi:PepSY domain-containing protein [Actinoplanes sp. NPDC049118]|uniref:PepSY domain-containing protein n=1 Tax=Actinoplanes sp. NPDC049118 TaxID=3155769 RepID=UPI0033CC7991
MIRLRTVSTLAAGVAAALALGGTALAAGGDEPTPSASPDDRGGAVEMLPNGDPVPTGSADDDAAPAAPAPAATTPPAASPRAVTIDAARTIALRAAGGGRVTGIESETEHGRAVWDVDVVTDGVRHDIDVDRATGAVLRHRVKTSGGAATRSSADDRRGRGSDDNGTDDHGRGGHGSDDNGTDDHGRGGHGSDD